MEKRNISPTDECRTFSKISILTFPIFFFQVAVDCGLGCVKAKR